MLLHGTCFNDARVLNEAKTLAEAGYLVKIFAVSDRFNTSMIPVEEEPFDGVSIKRLFTRSIRLKQDVSKVKISKFFLKTIYLINKTKYFKKEANHKKKYLSMISSALDQETNKFQFDRKAILANKLFAKTNIMRQINILNTLKNIVIEENPSIIHVHDFPALVAGSYLSDKLRCKLIYDTHELFYERSKKHWTYTWFGKLVEAYCVQNFVHVVITVNSSIASRLNKFYNFPSVKYIRNFPRREKIKKRNAKYNLKKSLGIKNNYSVALFHGGFGQLRGLHNLVMAGQYIENQNIKIVLMGKGGEESKLKSLIDKYNLHNCVKIIPPVPHAELIHWVSSADFGVVAYPNSSMNTYLSAPNKIFEYFMAGIPVITVDQPEKNHT